MGHCFIGAWFPVFYGLRQLAILLNLKHSQHLTNANNYHLHQKRIWITICGIYLIHERRVDDAHRQAKDDY